MKRYQGLSRKLISASLVIALLAVAVCVGLKSNPGLAQGIPEVEWDKTFGGSDMADASQSGINLEIENASASGKAVFLFFYADLCHFCQEEKPIIDELEEEYGEKIAVIRVDCEDNPEAREEFGVTGFPTMLVISGTDADGDYLYQQFAGFTDRETLKESLDYVITDSGRDGIGDVCDNCPTIANADQVDVVSCGDTITTDTTLTADLLNCPGDGLVIGADAITLDCAGHTVSAGPYHACGVRTDGTLACWGANYDGQAAPPAGAFSQVTAGQMHTCGVRTDGTVACWGDNWWGQATPPAGTFSRVSAGHSHNCGVRAEGTLACWGWSGSGQTTPPTGTFSRVSAGADHNCGVRTDGTLACWGLNDFGQAAPAASTFSQVGAGYRHTCGVRTDGSLACWGLNDFGQTTPPAGTIVIVKATDPPGGTGFAFTDNIAAPNSFSLDDGGSKTFSNVFTDTYTVIEDDPQVTPGGFDLTGLTCVDPDGGSTVDLGARKATIDLDAGETVTCTFTNTPPDADGDGVPDGSDLCPGTPPGATVDGDGCSDAQVDGDDDGICDPGAASAGPSQCQLDPADNCPTVFNPDQYDSEQPPDGLGDVCDPDTQNSSAVSGSDGSISLTHESGAISFDGSTAGPYQTVAIEEDASDIGTIEVTTRGRNRVSNKFDILSSGLLTGTVTKVTNFPEGCSQQQLDNLTVKKKPNLDIPHTVIDTQPATAPYTQATITFDLVDDATFVVLTPADSDSDGVYDQYDLNEDGDFDDPGELDNCPNTPNPDQADSDGDGIGDVCEEAPSPTPTPTPTPTSPPPSGGGGGFCFIATAAYGSYLDSHVETLRNFRDQYLLTNPVGSALVSTYYKLSPPVAEFIDDHPALKPVVRAGLMPAVAMSTVAVNTTLGEKMAMVGSMALVSVALAVWLSRRRGRGSQYS